MSIAAGRARQHHQQVQ